MKFLTVIILSLISCLASAKGKNDIHYITLLPVISNLNRDDLALFEEGIENAFKDLKQFHYKTHEGFYSLIKEDPSELKAALYTPDVITIICDKLSVGSLIRLEVNEVLLGYDVKMDILNPKSKILYSRSKLFNQKSLSYLNGVIKFWLNSFVTEIPFDGTIIEVQKDQLLVDYPGDKNELFINKQFVVLRELTPLSGHEKEEVKFKEIARGVVAEISKEFFVGKILTTEAEYKTLPTDLIQFKVYDEKAADALYDYQYRKHDVGTFRNYGRVALLGSMSKVAGDSQSSQFLGSMFQLDLYLPSKLVFLLEFNRKVGKASGNNQTDSTTSGASLNSTSYRALFGYTFEPNYDYLKFADVYAGWAVNQEYLSGLGILGVGDVYFEGPAVGLRMEHPIYAFLSALSQFEYGLNPTFKEHHKVLGEAESVTSFMVQLGLRYRFRGTGVSLDGLFRKQSTKADIANSNATLNIDTNQIFLGASLFF